MAAKTNGKTNGKRTNGKWQDEYYVTAYQLARSGCTDKEIAEGIGTTAATFVGWKKRRPALADAVRRGRGSDNNTAGDFIDFIYKRVPPHIQKLLDDISGFSKERNGVVKIEKLLNQQGKRVRQHLFLHSLVACNFKRSEALARVNMGLSMLQYWINSDPDFAELMNLMHEHFKDFCEAGVLDLVKDRNPMVCVQVNKAINRDRGYGDKFDHHHHHQHDHTFSINIGELDLPMKVREQLLDALRKKKAIDLKEDSNGRLVPVNGNGGTR